MSVIWIDPAVVRLKGVDDALQSSWAPRNSAADFIEGWFCDFAAV
jgi:hypothetical protein